MEPTSFLAAAVRELRRRAESGWITIRTVDGTGRVFRAPRTCRTVEEWLARYAPPK